MPRKPTTTLVASARSRQPRATPSCTTNKPPPWIEPRIPSRFRELPKCSTRFVPFFALVFLNPFFLRSLISNKQYLGRRINTTLCFMPGA